MFGFFDFLQRIWTFWELNCSWFFFGSFFSFGKKPLFLLWGRSTAGLGSFRLPFWWFQVLTWELGFFYVLKLAQGGLKGLMCYNHWLRRGKNGWNRIIWALAISLYNFTSSGNIDISESRLLSGKSFISRWNINGPRLKPWGKPQLTKCLLDSHSC